MQKYLRHKGLTTELTGKKSAKEQLDILLTALDTYQDRCKPLFIFDNLESFQQELGSSPFKVEHQELFTQLILPISYHYPTIFTGRYPLPGLELSEEQVIDLNQASFNDFWKKCRVTNLSKAYFDTLPKQALAQATTQQNSTLEYKGLVELLHENFGGNYRALEWFDVKFQAAKDKFSEAVFFIGKI